MRCEFVAVGTELLLGQIDDTNGSWIGQQLALAGIDCLRQTKVGDNHDRMVEAIREALTRADAVIVCGGLGPTQDDITREAIAEVMGVELVRNEKQVERIAEIFRSRGRTMVPSNARQADVPVGANIIPQAEGTAPGLICPIGDKVVYALPGVPAEFKDMCLRAVLPDLRARAGVTATIRSRVVRVFGLPESTVAELLADRLSALDERGGNPTIAFLANAPEGIMVRITAKAADEDAAGALLDAEEEEVRKILGDAVFGTDDTTMESAVGDMLASAGLTLGLAESMTGGLIASRIVGVPGSSSWFRGGVVSYASEVKFDVLGVPEGPVVSDDAAVAMAEGAARVLGSDVGLSVTGVAGPVEQDDMPVGTAFFGITMKGETEVHRLMLPGDRERVRHYGAITALDLLRRRLMVQR